MIDSHLHLDDDKLADIADDIVADLDKYNVDYVINNSCDLASMRNSVRLANTYAKVYATIGMHPHTAKYFDNDFVTEMRTYASNPKVVAVGEIGLDYYYDLSERDVQRDVFAQQIEIADSLKLPITLHVRDAYGDAWDILRAQKKYLNNGVLWHCYSGSAEFARQLAREGHYFAFGGAITFKNADKKDVIDQVPFDHVLTETDSPYLSPVPLRGTVNQPKNITYVIAKLAELYGKTYDEVETQVATNTKKLFSKIL